MDGDGLKHSTNGTWLFAERPHLIHDQMVFKAGTVLLKAALWLPGADPSAAA